MRNIKYSLLLCFITAGFIGRPQSVAGIKHSYAFLTERQPGNVMVRPDGMPVHEGPDTLLTVYLELSATRGTAPIVWKSAWLKGVCYSINAMPAGNEPEAGTAKASHEKIVLRAAKGNVLWKLELYRADSKTVAPRSALPNTLLLEGSRSGKKLVLGINRLVELATIPSV